jgi:uncharacterized delta-60 repeat protein
MSSHKQVSLFRSTSGSHSSKSLTWRLAGILLAPRGGAQPTKSRWFWCIAWCARLVRTLALCSTFLAFTASTRAQWVSVDPAFPAGPAPSSPVTALARDAQGAWLVNGTFTNLSPLPDLRMARLDPTGLLDISFAPELDRNPDRIHSLPGGRILISGVTNVSGVARPGLARLNSDGSLDETFIPPWPANPQQSLVGTPSPDGSVWVTGTFTTLDGQPRNRIARLRSDGSLESEFTSPFAPTNLVWVAGVQGNGRALVAGAFNEVAGVTAHSLVRLHPDGSVDATFSSGLALNERIERAVLQPDDRLVAAIHSVQSPAGFDMPVEPRRLARFDSDGSLDPTFLVPYESAGLLSSPRVHALALQPDGKILMSGTFLRVHGTPRARVARLHPDGSLDQCFDVVFSADLFALTLGAGMDGSVVLGGLFAGLQGTWNPNLIRLLPAPDCDPGMIEFAISEVSARADAGRIRVPVIRYNGADRTQTVRFSTRDGSAQAGVDYDSVSGTLTFAPGQRSHFIEVPLLYRSEPTGARAFELDLFEPGGGADLGIQTSVIVKIGEALPGSAGAPDLDYQVALDGPVRRILPLDDGRILIAGTFTNVNGQLNPNVARLLPNGSTDTTFGRTQPLDGAVRAIALDLEGRLLVAGDFQHVDEFWRPGLARLQADGSLDEAFAPFDDWPVHLHGYATQLESILVLEDGGILCGGAAATTPHSWNQFLVKLSPDGAIDHAFSDQMPPRIVCADLARLSNGHVLVHGSGLGGALVPIRPDGSMDLGFRPPADLQFVSYSGSALAVMPDGRVTVAGVPHFETSLSDQPRLWRLNPDGSRDAGFFVPPPPVPSPLGNLTMVYTFSVAADGRVLVAGSFSGSGASTTTLARLHADGSFDPTFHQGTGLEPSPGRSVPDAHALVALPTGGWLLGGDFSSYDGFAQPHLVRLLPESIERPQSFSFGISNLTVWETNGPVAFEVWRAGDLTRPARVTVRAEDGTAVGGEDFVPLDLRLEFAPGQWSRTVEIQIIDDQLVEPVEQFTVHLLDPDGGYELANPSVMTVRIHSDDIGVEFVADQFHAVEEEGFAYGAVHWISGGSTTPVDPQVRIDIIPETGRSEDLGVDSLLVAREIDLSSGRGTNQFRIPILDNAAPDGTRIFRLELVGTANVIPGPRATALLIIEDRDFPTAPARGVAGVVEAIATAPNGGVYLAGDFTGVHGVTRMGIARLEPDGEVDLSFDPGTGADGPVTAIGIQSDGRLLIAGNFNHVCGVSRAGVARLETDGALDLSFDPGLGAGDTNSVPFIRAVLPCDDGSLWLGGSFTHFDGRPSQSLVRLLADGRVDSTFTSPFTDLSWTFPSRSWSPSIIQAVLHQPNDKILVVGWLHTSTSPLVGSTVTLIRLDPDGRIDDGFSRVGDGFIYPAWSVALDAQGRILAGMSGVTTNRWNLRQPTDPTNWVAIARFHPNGQRDLSFQVRNEPEVPYAITGVRQVVIQPDERILFSAGIFTSDRITSTGFTLEQTILGRLLPDGDWDNSFGMLVCNLPRVDSANPHWFTGPRVRVGGTQAPLSTAWLAPQSDGVLVLAGGFHAVNHEPRGRLARVDASGALRGRLHLELSRNDSLGLRLRLPGEVEVPYELEISTDLEHWSGWLFNGHPWWPLELWLPADDPARFYRATPIR